MAKIVHRQMPTPQNLPQKVPTAKISMKKPQSGSKFLVRTSGLGRDDSYGRKLIAPLTQLTFSIFWMQMNLSLHHSTVPLFHYSTGLLDGRNCGSENGMNSVSSHNLFWDGCGQLVFIWVILVVLSTFWVIGGGYG